MGTAHLLLGQLGETLAAEYLRRKGYVIRERNFKTPEGEIDFVAEEGRALVIVEVRTKASDLFGSPIESVNPKKQHKLRHMAVIYLGQRGFFATEIRFDVVGILLREGEEPQIELIRGAF